MAHHLTKKKGRDEQEGEGDTERGRKKVMMDGGKLLRSSASVGGIPGCREFG